MEHITTQDGSLTFRNPKFDECYHSKSGAIEEAFLKYVRPAEISGRKSVKILDVGFGLGYNVACALEEFFENNEFAEHIEIISLENDSLVLKEIQDINPNEVPLKFFKEVQLAAKNLEYKSSDGKIKIKIILDDAIVAIKKLRAANEKFDCVLLDGFSPKKNPEMWSEEFLRDIFSCLNSGAILTTYSYARHIRENLAKVGFVVSDGPTVGRRSPSTIAKKP